MNKNKLFKLTYKVCISLFNIFVRFLTEEAHQMLAVRVQLYKINMLLFNKYKMIVIYLRSENRLHCHIRKMYFQRVIIFIILPIRIVYYEEIISVLK